MYVYVCVSICQGVIAGVKTSKALLVSDQAGDSSSVLVDLAPLRWHPRIDPGALGPGRSVRVLGGLTPFDTPGAGMYACQALFPLFLPSSPLRQLRGQEGPGPGI